MFRVPLAFVATALLAMTATSPGALAQAAPTPSASGPAPAPTTVCSGAPSPGLFRACVNARPGAAGSAPRSMGTHQPLLKPALQGPGTGVTPRQLRAKLG